MSRHGSRHPKKKSTNAMMKELPKLKTAIIQNFEANKSQLSIDVIEALNRWNFTFENGYDIILPPEGRNEHKEQARRMHTRFPTIFLKDYDKHLYKV